MKRSKLIATILGVVLLMVSCLSLVACDKEDGKTPPVKEKFTVTFSVDGGSVIAPVTVEDGSKVAKPTNPTKSGFAFDNWYAEAALTTLFSFDSAIKADTTVYAKWTILAGEIGWVKPEQKLVIYNDIAKNRADRLNLDATFAGKVQATEDGENIETALEELPAQLVRNEETGLLPLGNYSIGYYSVDRAGKIHSTSVEAEVVDATQYNYYLFGKNSSAYALPAASGGEKWWNGGTGLRVSPDNVFTIPTTATQMPTSLLNSSNAKLIDYDDAALIINKAEVDITFKVNDVSGVHILMDASGFVKMMFEGIQQDFWNIDGQSKKTSAEFGAYDIVMKPGDFYFVLGNTETGNWYSDYSELIKDTAGKPTEKHWADGRFVAKNTVGGTRYGNVAMIKCGDTTLTTPYTNQMPYLKTAPTKLSAFTNSTINDAIIKGGIAIFDDIIENEVAVYKQDVSVAITDMTYVIKNEAGEVVQLTAIDTTAPIVYTIEYTFKDNASDEVIKFSRQLEIIEAPAKYISYTQDGVLKHFIPETVKLNATNDDLAFRINTNTLKDTTLLKYDNTFTGVKPSNAAASNKRPMQYASFVVYGADGNVKAYINATTQKLIYMKDGAIAEIGGAGTDQMRFFKLNSTDENIVEGAYEMQEGDVLYTAFHTGTIGNCRDFLGTLTLAIANKAGTTLAEKTVALSVVGYEQVAPQA